MAYLSYGQIDTSKCSQKYCRTNLFGVKKVKAKASDSIWLLTYLKWEPKLIHHSTILIDAIMQLYTQTEHSRLFTLRLRGGRIWKKEAVCATHLHLSIFMIMSQMWIQFSICSRIGLYLQSSLVGSNGRVFLSVACHSVSRLPPAQLHHATDSKYQWRKPTTVSDGVDEIQRRDRKRHYAGRRRRRRHCRSSADRYIVH